MRRIIHVIVLCGFSSALFAGQVAFGQKGGWSGRGGGGDRPMTAEEIQQRTSRTESFLTSLDANHNGIIEADEASSDQAKNMLDRIFGRANVTPRYPMAIKEILQIQETYYKNRGSGATPGASGGTTGSAAASPLPGNSMGFGSNSASGMAAPSSSLSPPGMGFGTPAPVSATTAGTTGSSIGKTTSTVSPNSSISPSAVAPSVGSSAPGSSTPGSTSETKPLHKSGRFLTARERLPKGLPSWFLEKDVNGDGQITMDEYTTTWTPEKAAEFDKYDLNHDGIITAEEVLKLEKKSGGSATASSH